MIFKPLGRLLPPGGQRGAAAVEFAIVAPLLIALLVGMMHFGLALFARIVVTNFAHSAVRSCVLQQTGDKSEASYRACAVEAFGKSINLAGYGEMCRGGAQNIQASAPEIANLGGSLPKIRMLMLELTCNRNISPVVNVVGPGPDVSNVSMRVTTAMPFAFNP